MYCLPVLIAIPLPVSGIEYGRKGGGVGTRFERRAPSTGHADICQTQAILRTMADPSSRPRSPAQESSMLLNALFPTRDIGTDPAKIRDWAQAAEGLGYAYIEVPDHVFGATARDGWTRLYNA